LAQARERAAHRGDGGGAHHGKLAVKGGREQQQPGLQASSKWRGGGGGGDGGSDGSGDRSGGGGSGDAHERQEAGTVGHMGSAKGGGQCMRVCARVRLCKSAHACICSDILTWVRECTRHICTRTTACVCVHGCVRVLL